MKSGIIIKSIRSQRAKVQWNKILENWINAHNQYMTECKGDNAYFYNERASLSILAAAVWKSKGIALEEYTSTKRYKNKNFNGRVDLWFQIENYYCIVEAKQLFKRVVKSNIHTISEDIDFKMKQSIEDAKASIHEEKRGFAIVFFSPSFNENKPIENEELIHEVTKSDYNFIAYVEGYAQNNYEFTGNGKRIYPIGFIIGKMINAE